MIVPVALHRSGGKLAQRQGHGRRLIQVEGHIERRRTGDVQHGVDLSGRTRRVDEHCGAIKLSGSSAAGRDVATWSCRAGGACAGSTTTAAELAPLSSLDDRLAERHDGNHGVIAFADRQGGVGCGGAAKRSSETIWPRGNEPGQRLVACFPRWPVGEPGHAADAGQREVVGPVVSGGLGLALVGFEDEQRRRFIRARSRRPARRRGSVG